MKNRAKQKLGDRELDIMQVLWTLNRASVAEVHQALLDSGHDIAYTTVQTMLNRLEVKGYVARDTPDRAHFYRPLLKKPAAVTSAIKRLADRFFSGSVEELATHLVARNLTPEQSERVLAIINKHREGAQK